VGEAPPIEQMVGTIPKVYRSVLTVMQEESVADQVYGFDPLECVMDKGRAPTSTNPGDLFIKLEKVD
jgi:hypothetical protein